MMENQSKRISKTPLWAKSLIFILFIVQLLVVNLAFGGGEWIQEIFPDVPVHILVLAGVWLGLLVVGVLGKCGYIDYSLSRDETKIQAGQGNGTTVHPIIAGGILIVVIALMAYYSGFF